MEDTLVADDVARIVDDVRSLAEANGMLEYGPRFVRGVRDDLADARHTLGCGNVSSAQYFAERAMWKVAAVMSEGK